MTETAKGVNRAIQNIETEMENASLKWTLGDYARLIQLRKEQNDDGKGHTTAGWTDIWRSKENDQ